MSAIWNVIRGVLGMFFDDGTLALAILALLVCTAFALHADWIGESAAMSILVGGTIAALLENVLRAARRASG